MITANCMRLFRRFSYYFFLAEIFSMFERARNGMLRQHFSTFLFRFNNSLVFDFPLIFLSFLSWGSISWWLHLLERILLQGHVFKWTMTQKSLINVRETRTRVAAKRKRIASMTRRRWNTFSTALFPVFALILLSFIFFFHFCTIRIFEIRFRFVT